jgi:hypothetical protein
MQHRPFLIRFSMAGAIASNQQTHQQAKYERCATHDYSFTNDDRRMTIGVRPARLAIGH